MEASVGVASGRHFSDTTSNDQWHSYSAMVARAGFHLASREPWIVGAAVTYSRQKYDSGYGGILHEGQLGAFVGIRGVNSEYSEQELRFGVDLFALLGSEAPVGYHSRAPQYFGIGVSVGYILFVHVAKPVSIVLDLSVRGSPTLSKQSLLRGDAAALLGVRLDL
jgi:hypothetical protein